MTWLYARYLSIRGAGWFVPSAAGGWPVPAAWQGWAVLAAVVATIIATLWLPAETGWLVRVGAGVIYMAFSVVACG